MKLANCDIKGHQQDFKPNLTLLNEIREVTATIISSVTHKQKSFK